MYYPRRSPLETAAYLFVMAIILVTLFLAWPMIQTRIAGAPGREQPQPTTRAYATTPAYQPQTTSSGAADAVPTASMAQIEATSQAMYQATVQAVNTASDSAPMVREQISVDRQPAPAVVPTAEPVIEGGSDGAFGSKPVIVAPQATHECRHGQIWTDAGCKNPTPTQ
jgi:hypothetical protein